MTVAIVTDSAADLPLDVARQLGVTVVPLNVHLDDTTFADHVELTPDAYWERAATVQVPPTTSAPSIGAFAEAFRNSDADQVVCLSLSSRLSATYQAAVAGAAEVEGQIAVTTIDSSSVTAGLGNLVRTAAEMAQRGESAEAIVETVSALIPRTRVYAVLDELETLHRGGRIGGATKLLGSMLSIKPIIEIRNGVVQAVGKPRTRAKALQQLVALVAQYESIEHVAVMNGAADDVEFLIAQLKAAGCTPETIGTIGPVIGAHAGRGVIGVTFTVSP